MELHLKMDSKFVPAYNKNGRWIFCNQIMYSQETESWFKKENLDNSTLTTLIPYNCEVCPSWMRSLYVKFKLNQHFGPKEKEF